MRKRLYRLFQWLYKGVPVIKVTPQITFTTDSERLRGKRIVIVGGTRGLGLHIAKKCQDCGAEIVIIGRNEETLREASSQLGDCKHIRYDITDFGHLQELIDQVDALFGGQHADSLVYNASLYLHEHNGMEVTQEGFDRQFETNLKAPFFLSQYFIKYLMKAAIKPANLLFISSEMGLYCSDVPYGLGKASLNSMVEGLARRYVNDCIRVNAIAPGVLSNEASDVTKDDLYRKYSCGQRFIMPEEVAEVASFILSDASNCITGAVIPCNQGNHLRCDW